MIMSSVSQIQQVLSLLKIIVLYPSITNLSKKYHASRLLFRGKSLLLFLVQILINPYINFLWHYRWGATQAFCPLNIWRYNICQTCYKPKLRLTEQKSTHIPWPWSHVCGITKSVASLVSFIFLLHCKVEWIKEIRKTCCIVIMLTHFFILFLL